MKSAYFFLMSALIPCISQAMLYKKKSSSHIISLAFLLNNTEQSISCNKDNQDKQIKLDMSEIKATNETDVLIKGLPKKRSSKIIAL